MKRLVGGPLSVGGLGPWPPAPLKSGPAANNYQNSPKRVLLRRKKLHWPRLIWPTRYILYWTC